MNRASIPGARLVGGTRTHADMERLRNQLRDPRDPAFVEESLCGDCHQPASGCLCVDREPS